MRAKWTEEQFKTAVKESSCIREIAINLGLRPSGSSYKTIKKWINLFELDFSHLKVVIHTRNENSQKAVKKNLNDLLTENSNYQSSKLRERLIQEKIFDEKCNKCGAAEWMGKKIPLELEHKNGVNTDNRIENIELLCPNCHAQTPTYRGKNKKYNKEIKCKICGNTFASKGLNYCSDKCKKDYINTKFLKNNEINIIKKPKKEILCERCGNVIKGRGLRYCGYECSRLANRYCERPSFETLKDDLSKMSMVKVGEKYGVSDKAIAKWIKHYHKNI